jgi:tRNA (guanosine-2'-O-)-methyltransferase
VSITQRRRRRVQSVLQRRLGSVVVVLEAVNRRHNASAILRSCECFGLHEVHLIARNFKPSKGAARGSERWLEVVPHLDSTSCIEGLKARGFSVYAADIADDAHSPDSLPIEGKVAILMGAELTGVSDEARGLVDGFICVPMRGMTESLNVSVAAACIISRVAERKRALVGGGDLSPERIARYISDWQIREESGLAGIEARARRSTPPG